MKVLRQRCTNYKIWSFPVSYGKFFIAQLITNKNLWIKILELGKFNFWLEAWSMFFIQVTVNDGYLIFRWWLPHPIAPKNEKSDKGSSKKSLPNVNVKSRISIQLSGCDWHYLYNESVYGTDAETKDEKPKSSSGSYDWLWDLCPYFEIQAWDLKLSS